MAVRGREAQRCSYCSPPPRTTKLLQPTTSGKEGFKIKDTTGMERAEKEKRRREGRKEEGLGIGQHVSLGQFSLDRTPPPVTHSIPSSWQYASRSPRQHLLSTILHRPAPSPFLFLFGLFVSSVVV